MITFFWLWLLLAVSPLLAKSITTTVTQYQEGEDVPEVDKLLATSRSSPSSLPERFLQIAHKNCQGPEGQPGTCMFNFECQQQRGQVVGACLDGFLFGACCHLSTDQSMNAALVSTLQAVGVSAQSDSADNSTTNVDLKGAAINGSVDFLAYGSLRVPTTFEENLPDRHEAAPELPLELMFKNGSIEANKLATLHQLEKDDASESTNTSSAPEHDNKGTGSLSDGVSLTLTALSDNQISSGETIPTTAGSVVVEKGDPDLHAQLTALLQAHTESSKLPQQELQSTSASSVTSRVPVRIKGQSNKRPRPKPTTASIKNTEVTSTSPPNVESAITNITNAIDETNAVVTESLADQQANLLQFLVSNPPAWVLDEIINGSTLTTWYPLPIAENGQVNLDEPSAEMVTPSSSVTTSAVTRPLKRKPVKLRPQSSIKIASTTVSTVNQMDDQSDISETTTAAPATTDTTVTTPVITRKPRPVFDYTKDCGVRPMAPEARIVGGRRADYGRWPWQVLIRESTWFGIFSKNKCGGVLISDRHVLTAAHCQPGFLGSLLVVLGEFDLTGHSEPNTPMEKNVKRVVVHRDYVERTFENDLAILELESPVEFKPYIVPICLPMTSEGDFVGKKAEVTGWGKLSHNGPTPGVLYEVDVPIMSNPECHDMFKKAGHEKRILDSFLCAGYSEGKKDSCEGDSGGPLMLERDDGRWSLVGTVSHGIRCAYPNMPGVYMRMTYYRPWIERVTGIGGAQLG